MRAKVLISLLGVMLQAVVSTTASVQTDPRCISIQNRYSPSKKYLRINEKKDSSKITLYWGSDPARAASALFKVVLRDAIGFEDVELIEGPHHLNHLIRKPQLKPFVLQPKWALYRRIVLVLSTAWNPEPNLIYRSMIKDDYESGLAGHRLQEFGTSPVPVRQRLHVHLADQYQYLEQCRKVILWSFYTVATALKACGFFFNALDDQHVLLKVYGLEDPQSKEKIKEEMLKALETRDSASSLSFKFENLMTRKNLFEMFRSSNQSFLFIDYEMWSGHPNVSTIQTPPCVSKANTCQQDLDNTIPMRVGDVSIFRKYAPQILHLAQEFKPSEEAIREILEVESYNNSTIKHHTAEAACKWASAHETIVDKWIEKYKQQIYNILVIHCGDDTDNEEYDKFLNILNEAVQKEKNTSDSTIVITKYGANCADVNNLRKLIVSYFNSPDVSAQLTGVIIGGMDNIQFAVEAVAWANVPIVIYSSDQVELDLPTPAWFSTGQSLHQALALQHFILHMNLTHIAVLSDDALKAKNIVEYLRDYSDIIFHNYVVPHNLSQSKAENVLQEIQAANSRIIVVNTNAKDASIILSAAQRIGMDDPENYVWILNERPLNNIKPNMKYFTISLFCQGDVNLSSSKDRLNIRRKMDELWSERLWPTQAAALADAVFTLVDGFKYETFKYFPYRDDSESDRIIKLIKDSFRDKPIKGITHEIKYRRRLIEKTLVFVDEWNFDKRKHLARFVVNATSRTVHVEHNELAPIYSARSSRYMTSFIDRVIIILLFLLVLISFSIFFIHYSHPCSFKMQNHKNVFKLSTRPALTAFLLKRSAVKIYRGLGAGQFGKMHLAILCDQGRKLKTVFMKEIHKVENEMLREACILASLDHDRIIRLVGVCIDDQPPLLLMELAFFGDLLKYLRARRYLAMQAASKICVDCKEASYVSAEALTKLAYHAASAIAYLSLRGIIHHNLCAAECLVDANRCLKLSGFGRSTVKMDQEHQKNRPLKKEIQVVTPESITGNFTAATDIWAFGVLVFELVTLGEKPYGDMSPLCIKQLVKEGGHPQLPIEASPQTKELVEMCWQQMPEERVTAMKVMEYLTEHPSTLHPAVVYEQNDHLPIASFEI